MIFSFNENDRLNNGCSSEKILNCMLAAHSHEAISSIVAFQADTKHDLINMAKPYLNKFKKQEVLYLKFKTYCDNEYSTSMAVIYEMEDLVIFGAIFTLNEEEDHEYIEPMYPMKTSDFFKYVNSLPNIKKHIPKIFLDKETIKGLKLLKNLESIYYS